MPNTLVSFKKGLLANLNSTAKVAGQFLVTTDERAIYLDTDSNTRIRLGDFIPVASLSALPATGASQNALYYAEAENVLARFDGTKYVQINPDDDHQYRMTIPSDGVNAGKLVLEETADGTTWTAKSVIEFPDTGVLSVDVKTGETAISVDNTDDSNPKIGLNITATQGNVTLTKESDGLKANVPANTFDAYGDAAAVQGNTQKTVADLVTEKQDALGFEGTYDKTTNKVVTKSAMDTAITNAISTVYKYKGSVHTYADLPDGTTGHERAVGDVYNVATADPTHGIKAGDNVAWDGTGWDVLSGDVDLSSYYTKTDTDTLLNGKVDKVEGKQLSTEDYTTAEKTKLEGIEAGAEVNVLEGVQVNGTDLTIDANKKVNIVTNTAYNASTNKIATMTDISDAALAWGEFTAA